MPDPLPLSSAIPTPRRPSPTTLACVCLTAAAVNYAVALTFSRGFTHSTWLIMSLGSFLLAIAAMMFLRRPEEASRRPEWPLILVASAGLLVQVLLLRFTPMSDAFERMQTSNPDLAVTLSRSVAVIGLAGIGAAAYARQWKWTITLLIAAAVLHVMIGVAIIRQAEPFMDVWVFHQDAAKALLSGQNPYAIDFPNIYGDDAWVYSKEVMKDGRVTFGFPYPPLSLLMYLPSYMLTGESRYAHLLALTFTALLTWRISRSTFAILAATLILTVPVGWRVVEFCWSEPFLILTFAIVAWAGVRHPRLLPYALGAFLCCKQYCVVFVPLVWLLLPRPLSMRSSGIFLLKMIGTGAVISLPLALWNWPAFWHSNVTIQVLQPFRRDSFSFPPLLIEWLYPETAADGTKLPPPPARLLAMFSIVPFLAMLLAYVIGYFRSARTIGGFCLALSLTAMIFLFTNRQAFLNYHLFAQMTLLISAVTIAAERAESHPSRD